MKRHIKVDAQGGGNKKKSVGKIRLSDNIWRMTRSINYNKCYDSVIMQVSDNIYFEFHEK